MLRTVFVPVLLLALCFSCSPAWAARAELIPETTAARHGLTRPWFAQVSMDRGRGRLRDLVLYDGVLYAQTNAAVIHAIDAETGKTLWSRRVGDPKHPSMTPGAGHDRLAVLNGSRLFVLDRSSGELLQEKEIDGAPGAGPALSAKRVYIPMGAGLIVSYSLDKPSLQPLFCQSYGRALVQPLVTRENEFEECVVWPTDRGFLNLARIDRRAEDFLTLKYRLETGAEIVGQPAYLPAKPKVAGDSGTIVAASRDGFVYAIAEHNGERLWRFTAGEPMVESPAVVEDRVYVSTQLGGMYCLAVNTGKSLWFAPKVFQFVAAGKSRVYAADRVGRLLVFDARNGAPIDAIAAESAPIKLLNTDTDRIYLADEGGLIQCLHEVEQSKPIDYAKDRKQSKAATEKKQRDAAADKPAKKPAPKKPDEKKDGDGGQENDPFSAADGNS